MKKILITLMLIAASTVCYAEYCSTDCWTDSTGDTHCSTRCL
jgi:hypothetical protein